jgi:hypothetical protein
MEGRTATMRIWKRRSEWDYSWVRQLQIPAEVILCCIYEHCRYALLKLPEDFAFPKDGINSGALPHLFADLKFVGPIFVLGASCPPKCNFPFDPYRAARKQIGIEPEALLELLDDFSDPRRYQEIAIRLSPHATRVVSEDILAGQRKRFSGSLARPKRGAGARVRQGGVALKYLGAHKLRELMTAPEAMCHTAESLGEPLLATEAQWSRARKGARKNLAPYQAEAEVLLRAFAEKRELSSFTYWKGKSEVAWKAEN